MKILLSILLSLWGTFLSASTDTSSNSLDDDFVSIPRSVLVVEDDAISAMFIQLMVVNYCDDKFGIKPDIEFERTAEDAIRSFDIYEPDLVFLDYSLIGEGTGLDVLNYIRKNKKKPITVITCSSCMHKNLELYKHGAHHIMQKPIFVGTFNDTLNNAYFPNDK